MQVHADAWVADQPARLIATTENARSARLLRVTCSHARVLHLPPTVAVESFVRFRKGRASEGFLRVPCSEPIRASDLVPGTSVLLADHRRQPLSLGTEGTLDEGWILGSLIGDGTWTTRRGVPVAVLNFWEPDLDYMMAFARDSLRRSIESPRLRNGSIVPSCRRGVFAPRGLVTLARRFSIGRKEHKTITDICELASQQFQTGLIRGLFDADGSVQGTQGKGISVRLTQVHAERLYRVQRMLHRLGIRSELYLERRPAGARMMPDGHGGLKEYQCQATHELIIANDNIIRYRDLIGFAQPSKQTRLDELISSYKRLPNRELWRTKVVSVTEVEVPVVDIDVAPGQEVAIDNFRVRAPA